MEQEATWKQEQQRHGSNFPRIFLGSKTVFTQVTCTVSARSAQFQTELVSTSPPLY